MSKAEREKEGKERKDRMCKNVNIALKDSFESGDEVREKRKDKDKERISYGTNKKDKEI